MKTVAVIQARMGSRRLPGKTMIDLNGKPLIWHLINRARQSKVDEVILATTNDPKDDSLCDYVATLGVKWYRGDAKNLLDRYLEAVVGSGASVWTQIYGDSPCIDPQLIDLTLDNIGNCHACWTAGFPRGLNAYSFTRERIVWARNNCLTSESREFHHQFMSEGGTIVNGHWDIHGFEFCIDTPEDYEYIKSAYADLGDNFHVDELVEWAMHKAVSFHPEDAKVRNI